MIMQHNVRQACMQPGLLLHSAQGLPSDSWMSPVTNRGGKRMLLTAAHRFTSMQRAQGINL